MTETPITGIGANATALPSALTFQGTDIRIIDRDGHPWVTAADLGRALGYSRGDKAGRLYERNKAEFSEDMTAIIETPISGGSGITAKVRIFSPRGCHLIAMFARTARARAFRRWVLDVLDRVCSPLTDIRVGAMLVLGGVETSEGSMSGSRPDSIAAIFMPGLRPGDDPLRREGEEYNTRKGNNSARSLTHGSSS
ncbi:MAG: hypothetical protein K2Q10_14240, partial [Rhodospirillales bacterium]|nr:hypothetical protein [Rhodospirillales bacterium]